MRSLINFIFKYNHWFLFILLEAIGLSLLFHFNNYQGSVYFTSANRISGSFYEFFGNINAYFELHETNQKLFEENLQQEQEIQRLKERLETFSIDSLCKEVALNQPDAQTIIGAEVVNNSLNKTNNYITINKGKADGIRPEMGIFNEDGVVGIVYLTSSHYALAIPLLNPKSNISCKIKNSENFCSLIWKGGNVTHAHLQDLPRHTNVAVGDTVVTSGYSSIFPKGIAVGIIDELSDSPDGLFYQAKVRLAVDFSNITYIYVLSDESYQEQKALENQIPK